MNTIEPDATRAARLRAWLRAARQQLAVAPARQRHTSQGHLKPAQHRFTTVAVLACPASAPVQNGLDGPPRMPDRAAAALDAADWDLLFRAALAFLDTWAQERAQPDAETRHLQPPGLALCECLQALDQLRRTAPRHPGAELHAAAQDPSPLKPHPLGFDQGS